MGGGVPKSFSLVGLVGKCQRTTGRIGMARPAANGGALAITSLSTRLGKSCANHRSTVRHARMNRQTWQSVASHLPMAGQNTLAQCRVGLCHGLHPSHAHLSSCPLSAL